MCRRHRLFIPGIPSHVTQRGNNKNPIFLARDDYVFFLKVLREAKIKYPCFIYAYCLMPNHFHLMIESHHEKTISLLIKFVGVKYVYYINKKYNRTGTLWEGRFKSSLVEQERYFLACLRYIELNPLRAGLVKSPDLYQWSSYRFHAYGERNQLLDYDQIYLDFGAKDTERQLNYRKFVNQAIVESELELIRTMTNRDGVIGSDSFINKVKTGVRPSLGRV